jgi:murein hydrolase activator
LFQDLQEQEGILELNKQLQVDLLKKRHAERLSQLESYRKLKSAENQVEKLITQFNARVELQRSMEAEKVASKAMMQGAFAKLKGKLPLPARGRVISFFGKAYDSASKLNIFKKGIDIASGRNQPVHAISAGRVAYSGDLPGYGRVTIIDHGEHFYSLCAHLGELNLKVGSAVAAGDPIGTTDDAGTPVYFEIRARNIAVNPLQWVTN